MAITSYYNLFLNLKGFKKRSSSTKKIRYNPRKEILIASQTIVPLRLVRVVRRFVRKAFIKKRIRFGITIALTYSVSYKGKNPRMGKGVGYKTRAAASLPKWGSYIRLSNIAPRRAAALSRLLTFYMGAPSKLSW